MEKIIYGVNGVCLFFIVRYEHNSTSDKTIIISGLLFLTLVGLNLLLGFFAQLDKNPIYRHYYQSVFGLFVGVMVLATIYSY